jgi:peptidyl-prolyl cis-trans isomerase D
MLKLMRKHAKYFYVLFVVVILSFIFWGVGRIDENNAVPLAEVGEWKITLEEYWRTYDRIADLYREIYKEKFDEEKLNLKDKVLNLLIEERVLLIAAAEAGITVSDEELEDAITHDPAFTRDGVFSKEIYLRTLELNRLTPRYYEEAKRRELMLKKIKNLVYASVDLSPSELKSIKDDETARETFLEAKREAALRSFVEGLKKQVRIKVNKDLIS